jgi:flagellar hook-associated protein 1 FlgK
MASTFFGLNTALSGILAHQRALDTTTHNLVNAGTEGYTRQRVTMRATPAFPMPAINNAVGPGQLGTGVAVVEYARLRDQFTDLQFRSQNASFGQYEARSDALNRLDQVIDEPGDTGLTSLLDKFWASWQSLSTQAESPAVREAVRSAASSLVQGLHDTRAQLVSSQGEADARITAAVTDVNTIAGQVNQLNQAISKVIAVNQDPNDLIDQRDLLIDSIAKQANIAITPVGTTGRVTIALGGQVLVDGATNTTQALAVSPAGVVTVGAANAAVTDGALRGLIDIRDTVIGGATGYIANLDLLAQTVIGQVNTRHAAGVGLDGTTGNAFFAGADAATIALSAAVAGSTDKIAASSTAGGLPAGGDNAVSLAQLKYVSLLIGTGTSTIDGFWGTMVSRLGLDVDQSKRLAAVQGDVLDNAIARRDAVSGVNQDEEAADMIRFQKSYNAAARMVTTLDSMLETIVSNMGLVGR